MLQLSEFRCRNGEKCIQKYQKCNHRDECGDGSDEQDCGKFNGGGATIGMSAGTDRTSRTAVSLMGVGQP